jgi:hypothetical protein
MKTNRLTFALIAGGLLAVAAVAVAVGRTLVDVDGVVGYGAVVALVAFAALDYGYGRRRLFSK